MEENVMEETQGIEPEVVPEQGALRGGRVAETLCISTSNGHWPARSGAIRAPET